MNSAFTIMEFVFEMVDFAFVMLMLMLHGQEVPGPITARLSDAGRLLML